MGKLEKGQQQQWLELPLVTTSGLVKFGRELKRGSAITPSVVWRGSCAFALCPFAGQGTVGHALRTHCQIKQQEVSFRFTIESCNSPPQVSVMPGVYQDPRRRWASLLKENPGGASNTSHTQKPLQQKMLPEPQQLEAERLPEGDVHVYAWRGHTVTHVSVRAGCVRAAAAGGGKPRGSFGLSQHSRS